jgi:hypothetical protein
MYARLSLSHGLERRGEEGGEEGGAVRSLCAPGHARDWGIGTADGFPGPLEVDTYGKMGGL